MAPDPPSPVALSGSPPADAQPPPPSKPVAKRTRRGTVARLPKDTRARINEMLDDALTYREIISELGEEGSDLVEDHIRRWKAGGYQDYLREQRLIEECRARSGRSLDLLRQSGHVHGFQATQQLATAQICEALAAAGPELLRQALAASPLNYFRMLNSFARLTTGGLKCQRFLDDQAESKIKNRKSKIKKGLSLAALKEMNEKLHLM